MDEPIPVGTLCLNLHWISHHNYGELYETKAVESVIIFKIQNWTLPGVYSCGNDNWVGDFHRS